MPLCNNIQIWYYVPCTYTECVIDRKCSPRNTQSIKEVNHCLYKNHRCPSYEDGCIKQTEWQIRLTFHTGERGGAAAWCTTLGHYWRNHIITLIRKSCVQHLGNLLSKVKYKPNSPKTPRIKYRNWPSTNISTTFLSTVNRCFRKLSLYDSECILSTSFHPFINWYRFTTVFSF